jgi:hypothetical protein
MKSDYLLLRGCFSLGESHALIMSTRERGNDMKKESSRGHEWSIQMKVVIRTIKRANQETGVGRS